jgi:iron-sulfur cluster assembly accessory protein
MAVQDENLDDVISSLIDGDGEEEQQAAPSPQKPVSENPVSLTKRAARQVELIRKQEEIGDDLYLRVAVEGGGCAGLNYKLGFDYRNSDDNEYQSEEIPIIINPKHLMYLDGIVIDYPDGLDARGFTFDNPNASENCGCGSSFAI